MSFSPVEHLQGQTTVITGINGAVAQAVAKRLSQKGSTIIGLARRNLDQAQQFLNSLGPNNQVLQADVTQPLQVRQAIEQINACDILVNAAGGSVFVPHANTDLLTDDLFDSMLINNLRSNYTVIRTLLPLLKQSQQALIVNIGSTASYVGGSNLAYAAAKAGMDNLTRNLSRVIAPVRIISINPGGIETEFVKNRPENFYSQAKQSTPLGRLATPDDVAAAVESYATLIRFATGISVTLDGGKTV